jgi:hypothetical protein
MTPAHPVDDRPTRTALARVESALALLTGLGGADQWVVSRMTEDTWTGLASRRTARGRATGSTWADLPASTCTAGTSVPRDQSLCHLLLVGRPAVVVPDLAEDRRPDLRRLAREWGLRAYLGVALRSADGHRLGSLVGLSGSPLPGDPGRWGQQVAVQGGVVQAALDAASAAVEQQRRESWGRSLRSRDAVTGLADGQGWQFLLAAEERLAGPIGDPVGLAVVDIGTVRTARGVARAAAVAQEHAGGCVVARVGSRRLGLLGGGRERSAVARTAAAVQAHLRDAGFDALAASGVRLGAEPLTATWARVDAELSRAVPEPAGTPE